MFLKSFNKKKFLSLISSTAFVLGTGVFLLQPVSAHAWGGNYYGSCANPAGTPAVSYSSGYHWIVGNSQLQWGSDSVYSNGNNQYTQCYCPLTVNNQPASSMGTQTNWVPASSVSAQQKQMMLSSGWIDIANGSAFGLPAVEYLAQNVSFACSVPMSQNTNQVSISQNNSSYVHNNVYSQVNTGGNRASFNTGGNTSVVTGNASTNTSISTNVNSNYLNFSQSMQHWMDNISASIQGNGAFSSNSINH